MRFSRQLRIAHKEYSKIEQEIHVATLAYVCYYAMDIIRSKTQATLGRSIRSLRTERSDSEIVFLSLS